MSIHDDFNLNILKDRNMYITEENKVITPGKKVKTERHKKKMTDTDRKVKTAKGDKLSEKQELQNDKSFNRLSSGKSSKIHKAKRKKYLSMQTLSPIIGKKKDEESGILTSRSTSRSISDRSPQMPHIEMRIETSEELKKKSLEISEDESGIQIKEDLDAPYETWIEDYLSKGDPDNDGTDDFYRLLLTPDSRLDTLRQDFFIAAPWMNFIEKNENQDLLVTRLVEAYQEAKDKEKIDSILGFAKELIKKGILPRDKMEPLLEEMEKKEDSNLVHFREEVREKPLHKMKSISSDKNINYVGKNSDDDRELIEDSLKRIAAGKMSKTEKKEFIKGLCNSLTVELSRTFVSINPREFHNEAWHKDPDHAPKLSYYINLINGVEAFLERHILTTQDKKGRMRLYNVMMDATKLLIEQRDYLGAFIIYSALTKIELQKDENGKEIMPKKSDVKKKLNELSDGLFSPEGQYKELREEIGKDKTPYLPLLSPYLQKLIGANENSQKDENGKINIYRLQIFAKVQKNIEAEKKSAQNILPKEVPIPYNLRSLAKYEKLTDKEIDQMVSDLKKR